MITAQVKKVAVSDLLVVPYLDFCEFSPVHHTWFEIEVIVDGVIVELFQLNPFLLGKQILIDPV